MPELDVLEKHLESDTLFFAFGGIGAHLVLNLKPFEFLTTIERLGVAGVFVRDRKDVWYQQGCNGIGTNIDALVEFARGMRTRYRRIVGVGNSMGGYAALLCGVLAGFDDVIAISPQTFVDRANWQLHKENRWMKNIERINQIPHACHLDLLPVLQATPTAARLFIIYGGLDRLDCLHAERLAGSQAIRLIKLTRCVHGSSAAALRAAGVYDSLIRTAASGGCLDSFFAGFTTDRNDARLESLPPQAVAEQRPAA